MDGAFFVLGELCMISRRHLICSAVAAACVTTTPHAIAADKKVKIAVGGKALYYYLPLSIAERLGYFKEEGLDVQIIDFQGGSRALQAVVGGSADVVSGAAKGTAAVVTDVAGVTADIAGASVHAVVDVAGATGEAVGETAKKIFDLFSSDKKDEPENKK